MMTRNTRIPASQWGVALLFAALSLLTLTLFVLFAEPPQRQPGVKFTQDYQESNMSLTEDGLKTELAAIERASTPAGQTAGGKPVSIGRMPGTSGYEATAKLIEDTFKANCDETKSQRFQVVVPITEICEIYDTQTQQPLPGVTLYPFEPAGLVPTVLPPNGISGPLVVVKSNAPMDLVKKPLENSIVLNDGLDCSWPTLASMGAKAVIVKEETFKQGDPDTPAAWNGMTNVFDQPYPRFLVRGPLEKFANHQLGIRCKVTWQSRNARNIVGVIHATRKDKTNEALIIACYYDSYSVVPDLAPGAEQAVSPAVMLQLVKQLAKFKRTITRDIVFVATSGHAETLEGVIRLNEAIETFTKKLKGTKSFETLKAEQEQKLAFVKQARELLDAEEPWRATDNTAYAQQWNQQSKEFRKWFEQCFTTVCGEINLERREDFLNARLAWIRGGEPNFRVGFNPVGKSSDECQKSENRDPLMNAYLAAKAEDNLSGNMLTTPFYQVAYQLRPTQDDASNRFEEWGYTKKLSAYLDTIEKYHRQKVKEYDDDLTMQALFGKYDKTLVVNLELYSGGAQQKRDLAVLMGRRSPGTVVEPQSTDLRDAIDEKVPPKGAEKLFKVTSWGSKDAEGNPNDPNMHSQWFTELESEIWFRCAREAFTIINKSFFPGKVGTPEDSFSGLATASLADQVPAIGKALLAVAHGKVGFKTIQYIPGNDAIVTFRGTVYANAGVSADIPNHRVGLDTFVHYYQNTGPMAMSRGIRMCAIIQTDPYGDYCRRFNFDMSMWGNPVTVDAARFDTNGYVTYYKDASAKSQATFKNEIQPSSELTIGSEKPINIGLFRANEVVCYQRGNPKTLNSFTSFSFLEKAGMVAPERTHPEIAPTAPGISAFLDPDCVFYIAMMDGSAQNPEVQTFRAFMLGDFPQGDPSNRDYRDAVKKYVASCLQPGLAQLNPSDAAQGELYGKGYLASGWQAAKPGDTMPYLNITYPYFDAAASMIRTNGIRLAKENQYYMADQQMLDTQDLAKEKLRLAIDARLGIVEKKSAPPDAINATLAAGSAVSYTINNHPVIRTKISNAIIGILWYLMILVPFVFFFEKLVFGFTDIRMQLLAYGGIFIVVFALLWYFHPAFQMVNQPLIILLGFLILLLALIVAMMVTGKFQQTIKVLRSKEGSVEGADVNRAGVIGTAFMLGLNNMRRRKVRTTLTCITLVLITFVMICFTAVGTAMNETQMPTGKSPSNGLMRRDPNFQPIQDGEINNLTQLYGLDYPISVNYWLVGAIDQTAFKNPDIFVDYVSTINGQQVTHTAKNLHGSIAMPWNEPAFSEIDKCLLTHRGWFPPPPQTDVEINAEKEKIRQSLIEQRKEAAAKAAADAAAAAAAAAATTTPATAPGTDVKPPAGKLSPAGKQVPVTSPAVKPTPATTTPPAVKPKPATATPPVVKPVPASTTPPAAKPKPATATPPAGKPTTASAVAGKPASAPAPATAAATPPSAAPAAILPPTEDEINAEQRKRHPDFVMLPDSAAKDLGLTVEQVDKGHEMVTIRGAMFEVCGIFDSAKLTAKMGIDGQPILPYDLNTVTQLGRSAKGAAIVPANIGRMNGSQVIITSKALAPKDASEQSIAVSVSVLFPGSKKDEITGKENGYFPNGSESTNGGFCDASGYRLRTDMPYKPWVSNLEQRRVVREYLERVGQGAYFAIDGYAYYGSRTRAKTTDNILFMLIPILIAALTVFNTMRSSVYERKDEIYVYNAVGIAPNHIFFMFMAEASVYAVMGAMLGYLLSQITGKLLIVLHATGGLNMDYSSIETIVASVVIVLAVLLSTIVPAYTASRLALPSDDARWSVPKADGDVMTFNLPFTFGTMDRLAVISYFYRWLDANGEGSAGSFYCAPPEPKIVFTDGEPNSNGLVPHIATTVWLKPFDLGVSQQLDIALPTDPETGEFIARITIERLSGTVSAWNRAVMPFLVALRKQFLNWRAVSDAERTEMFEEAHALLLKPYDQERANV